MVDKRKQGDKSQPMIDISPEKLEPSLQDTKDRKKSK